MATLLVKKRGVTLVELVAVAGSLAVLASLVMPGLVTRRTQQTRTACLANLRQLGAATLVYAAEDRREQIVPLHKMRVLAHHANGFCGSWSWRTALPFSFGGQTATTPFPTECGMVHVLQNDFTWGIEARPLNGYVAAQVNWQFPWKGVFHCPADVGYPALHPEDFPVQVLDAPLEAAGIPCFDFLGNSYRVNTIGLTWISGPLVFGSLESGVQGHTPAEIEKPSQTVLYSDPLFWWWSRMAPGYQEDHELLEFPGWHGQIMADNVAYADGSARTTEIGELHEWTIQELEEMGFSPQFMDAPEYLLRRGPTWRMDTYPSPGAVIKTYADSGGPLWQPSMVAGYTGWPFDGYTENEPPF